MLDDPTFFAPLCEQLAFIGIGVDGQEAECEPELHCNDVGVSTAELTCTQGDPSAFTNVNFSVDPAPYDGNTITIDSNCAGGPMQFTCESTVVPAGSVATIVGQCYDGAQCDPVCGPHYMLVGDTCKWDGTGTIGRECIAGTTYDPVNQCCAATPGSGIDYTVCPAGQHKFGGVCVDDLQPMVDSDSAVIGYDSCDPPGDTPCDPASDPTCNPGCGPSNPITCGGGKVVNPDGCSCRCPAGSTNCVP